MLKTSDEILLLGSFDLIITSLKKVLIKHLLTILIYAYNNIKSFNRLR